MTVVVITPPAAVVTTAEAKTHLGVQTSAFDAQIAGFVAAATAHLDGPTGWLGRCLGAQTLELRLDAFVGPQGGSVIPLPFGPILSVTSVLYDDTDGAEQDVEAEAFKLTASGLLMPAYATSWPSARCDAESVRIRYAAGYAVPEGEDAVAAIPPPIRSAILLLVGDLFHNRDGQVSGAAAALSANETLRNLLTPFRALSL